MQFANSAVNRQEKIGIDFHYDLSGEVQGNNDIYLIGIIGEDNPENAFSIEDHDFSTNDITEAEDGYFVIIGKHRLYVLLSTKVQKP